MRIPPAVVAWLLLCSAPAAEVDVPPWISGGWDSAKAVFFLPTEQAPGLIVDGALTSHVRHQVVMGKPHVAVLAAAISGPHADHPRAGCYEPRHGFVFYQGPALVGWFEICIQCFGYRYSTGDERQRADIPAVQALVTQLGLPYFEDFLQYETWKPPAQVGQPAQEARQPSP